MRPIRDIVARASLPAVLVGALAAGGAIRAEAATVTGVRTTDAREDEARLLAALERGVRAGASVEVSFGRGLDYRVAAVDLGTGSPAEAVLRLESARDGNVSVPPIDWPWPTIPVDRKLRVLRALALEGPEEAALARWCLKRGREEEAHEHLRALSEAAGEDGIDVDALLADHLGDPAGTRYVWFDGRFVRPAEREEALIRHAEAWRLAREAEEDERYERADSVYAKARWLQTRGFFELARALFRKVAALGPETDIGRRAREQVEDNAFLVELPLHVSGPSENRVDFIVLGDGYRLDDRHQAAFRRACEQMVDYLLDTEILGEYASYVNIRIGHVTSRESGVDNPTQDFSTALGGRWSNGSQGQVTVDHGLVRRMLAANRIVWDNAMVMVKRGGLGTGGGGISAFAHASTGTAFHELGHSFAGLLDEYNTQVSDTPNLGGAPRGVNIANSPRVEDCPWKHWIEAGVDGVGLFRGGAGGAAGAFRPTDSGCVMNSGSECCVVCREQWVRTIYRYVRPIESSEPELETLVARGGEKVRFEAVVLKPTSRFLEATWTFNGRPIEGGRREFENGTVREVLELELGDLPIASGYRGVLALRVRDTTDWVLADPDKRLEQTVRWAIERPSREEATTPGARPGPDAAPPDPAGEEPPAAPAKGEPAKGEAAKGEAAKGEPAKGEPAKGVPGKGDPAKGDGGGKEGES